MFRSLFITVAVWLAFVPVASADVADTRAEMAAALAAQADLHPSPVNLPSRAAAPQHAAAPSAVKRGLPSPAANDASARTAAQAQSQASSQALVHQAQAAAATAAGQAQAQAAKDRASHPHPQQRR
jgi:hypothetical protein